MSLILTGQSVPVLRKESEEGFPNESGIYFVCPKKKLHRLYLAVNSAANFSLLPIVPLKVRRIFPLFTTSVLNNVFELPLSLDSGNS